MPLKLPTVPVAVEGHTIEDARSRLWTFGTVFPIENRDFNKVIVLHELGTELKCLWAIPSYTGYRNAWEAAAREKLVDALSDYGRDIDVDHVYSRDWATEKLPYEQPVEHIWLRLHPVFREVNQAAGRSREKLMKAADVPKIRIDGVIYANELMILKMLGHPVGLNSQPESIFDC